MSETKTNFLMAVRGYKVVNILRNDRVTDVVALDNSNNRVLLRTIEPLTPEYVSVNEVRSFAELIGREGYDSAVLVSKNFTDSALNEMDKQNIQFISEDYMPPFEIQELYLAVINCANGSCQKKCGKVLLNIAECGEKTAYMCKTKALALNAKQHFETGLVGLLKNDLRVAFSLAP